MNVKQLSKILSKLDPNMRVMVINEYDRALSLKVTAEPFSHDGMECDGFNPNNKWVSNIPAGDYLFITSYEE